MSDELQNQTAARPLSEWHEDDGPVLWWKFPIEEPPYVGTPNDCGISTSVRLEIDGTPVHSHARYVGGWPGYHTHWTPIQTPLVPAMQCLDSSANGMSE